MGSTTPPKGFPSATPFGQSPQTPIATQVQATPQVQGAATPAFSGYNQTPQTAATPDPTQTTPNRADYLGDRTALRQRFTGGRGAMPMPFYG